MLINNNKMKLLDNQVCAHCSLSVASSAEIETENGDI